MNVFYCRRAGDLLGESSRVAPQQKPRAYALADAKPHFAPDRPCDIVHIALTLQLEIVQVRQAGGATLPYDYDGQRLRVTFPEPLQRGAPATVEVDYGVTKPRLGLYFIT